MAPPPNVDRKLEMFHFPAFAGPSAYFALCGMECYLRAGLGHRDLIGSCMFLELKKPFSDSSSSYGQAPSSSARAPRPSLTQLRCVLDPRLTKTIVEEVSRTHTRTRTRAFICVPLSSSARARVCVSEQKRGARSMPEKRNPRARSSFDHDIES